MLSTCTLDFDCSPPNSRRPSTPSNSAAWPFAVYRLPCLIAINIAWKFCDCLCPGGLCRLPFNAQSMQQHKDIVLTWLIGFDRNVVAGNPAVAISRCIQSFWVTHWLLIKHVYAECSLYTTKDARTIEMKLKWKTNETFCRRSLLWRRWRCIELSWRRMAILAS